MRQLRKMFTFSCHLLFLVLACHFTFQTSSLIWADRLLVLDAILLTLTYSHFVHILRTYGNVFSRILAIETLALGIPLSAAALYLGGAAHVSLLAGPALAAWLYFAYRYQRNKARYETQGCGPVPVDTCVKIPSEIVRPGDAIGTGGQMAKLLRQGVGHTECVIPWQGEYKLFSSWFETGACLNDVKRILKPDPKYPNYLLQRRPPLTAEQIELMEYVVRSMMAQNQAFREKVVARRARLPGWLRKFMDKHFPATGYDWLGRYTGRRAPDRWTCNVAYLEALRRSCVDVVRLGHGAAGLRTGWFDFPNTEDLRGDPALHLVRNAEVPDLLKNGQPPINPNADIADFDAQVQALINASTNVFDRSKRVGGGKA
jgi:hypothetical protein